MVGLWEWHVPGGEEYYNSQRREGDQLEWIKTPERAAGGLSRAEII